MKKRFVSCKIEKRENHNLTKEVIAMKNAINTTHIITQKVINNIDSDTWYHDIMQKDYNLLFAGYYPTKEDFITNNYINITKGFVKALALKCNVGFCNDIINKGYYGDTFFDDLTQIVALTLLENTDRIIMLDSNTWSIENTLKIDCLRAINHYGYNNKTRVNKTEVAIIDYDEKNGDDISIAVNTRAYKDYLFNEYDKKATENDVVNIWDIIDNVLSYIISHEKLKVYNGCKIILNALINGQKLKNIYNNNGLSCTTTTKYYKIIKNAYYELYKKPIPYNDGDTTATTTATAKISIDFSKCHIINRNDDILMDKVNKYYHDKKQAMYNKLFYATKYDYNSMVLRNRHNEKVYCKELQLDRR